VIVRTAISGFGHAGPRHVSYICPANAMQHNCKKGKLEPATVTKCWLVAAPGCSNHKS
jgi:hypothetical protein